MRSFYLKILLPAFSRPCTEAYNLVTPPSMIPLRSPRPAMRTDLEVATAHDLSISPPRVCPHDSQRILLPREAHDILEDYFLKVAQWPDMEARIGLARKVNAVLRCGCYTQHHVYMRFSALRRRKHFPGHRASSPNVNVQGEEDEDAHTMTDLGPAHSISVVAKLDVLLEEEPSPSPEIATIWADVLAEGVVPEDILTYALLRQVKRHMEGQNVYDRAFTQFLSSADSVPLSESRIGSPGQASPRRPVPYLAPARPSAPSATKKRGDRPKQPRIEHPQVASSTSPFRHKGTPSDREGVGDSRREPESDTSPNSPGPSSPAVSGFPQAVEAQTLAARIRHALSAPAGPQPRTFADLCAWVRGSGGATAL